LGASFILGCWVSLSLPNLFLVIPLLLLLDAPLPSAASNFPLLLFCFLLKKIVWGFQETGEEPSASDFLNFSASDFLNF
jgi:hypothetical protein